MEICITVILRFAQNDILCLRTFTEPSLEDYRAEIPRLRSYQERISAPIRQATYTLMQRSYAAHYKWVINSGSM